MGHWRASAVAQGLPDTIEALQQEAQDAKTRAAAVAVTAESLQDIGPRLSRVHSASQEAAAATRRAEQAVREAQASHAEVCAVLGAWEACRQRSGMDELTRAQAADNAQKAHAEAKDLLGTALSRMEGVSGQAGDARRAADDAVRRVEQAEPTAKTALARVHGLMAFDPMQELLGCPPPGPGEEHGDASGWLTDLRGRLEAIPDPGTPLEECATLVRLHLAGEDDQWQLTHGQATDELPAHQLMLTGCKAMSPPATAREAAARLRAAQTAYDAAEDEALQTFVLGRIPTAISSAWVDLHTWVQDINDQMKLARASSGHLVQLRVRLAPDPTPARARIHHLTCEIGDAARTPEQQHSVGQELLAVMRHGEEGGSTDRATRLAEAIDIRN
ncbi:hypothetical protein ACI2LO_33450 [Streptomyces sp. NPDC033754]|uniref:hypothetical protein n=1 Tax=unclassified Streptomyces TaxID=2593676 RepID=UPI0033DB7D20